MAQPPVRVGAVPPTATAFQPREDLRELIDREREQHTTVVLTQVLSGGGGVGKSQLAASYAQQAHAEGVDVSVWVNAAETAQIIAAYAQAAAKAEVPGADGQDAERDAAAFLDWLAVTDRSWLVVLDDLNDLEGAGPWWPRPSSGPGGGGRVLATTRRRDALVSGGGRAVVEIGTYSEEEALGYLRERLTAADAAHLLDQSAEDLIEALGRLPLALSHAAAYMINEGVGCTHYLGLFTRSASSLATLLPTGADTDGYGRQVTASLLLALDAAQLRTPIGLAAPAIRLAAYLDPAGHPEQLWATPAVTYYLTAHRTRSNAAPVTPDEARAAVRLLHHYGLLTHETRDGDRAVRLHALTARAARETTPDTETPATVRAAADALLGIWPEFEYTAPGLTAVLRANTDALEERGGDLLWRTGGHVVLFASGTSLMSAGLFRTAIARWHGLAADAERLLDDDHRDTLTARAQLAFCYWRAGRTDEAIVIEERVVADRERVLGDAHPDTLNARNNLAASYEQAGRTGNAIELLERVLEESERLLGDRHPDTLSARNNLAVSYGQAGRSGEAIDLLERVIVDREHVLGDGHPDTLTSLSALAYSYWQVGRTDQAIVIEERVVVDRERVLGDSHPDTLTARANLAVSYWEVGRTGEAIELLEGVLAESERVLGNDHPHTQDAAEVLRGWHAP
ncbi:tetratricopeptide repeat protein [Kitasatospora sp. NPDC051170]|uniref:tetratricopeptide repeat protein n=1 Tax=Kitasatospora sp. NPDC051170 TaxID=3364056 RepID=UPI003793AC02